MTAPERIYYSPPRGGGYGNFCSDTPIAYGKSIEYIRADIYEQELAEAKAKIAIFEESFVGQPTLQEEREKELRDAFWFAIHGMTGGYIDVDRVEELLAVFMASRKESKL